MLIVWIRRYFGEANLRLEGRGDAVGDTLRF